MEFSASIPIYLQVVAEIKRLLMSGELKPGEKLWSARDMAVRYKINPNTAARVYKELELQKLCFTRRGLGTFLTEEEGIAERLRKEKAEQLLDEFIDAFLGLGYTKEEMQDFFNTEFQKKVN